MPGPSRRTRDAVGYRRRVLLRVTVAFFILLLLWPIAVWFVFAYVLAPVAEPTDHPVLGMLGGIVGAIVASFVALYVIRRRLLRDGDPAILERERRMLRQWARSLGGRSAMPRSLPRLTPAVLGGQRLDIVEEVYGVTFASGGETFMASLVRLALAERLNRRKWGAVRWGLDFPTTAVPFLVFAAPGVEGAPAVAFVPQAVGDGIGAALRLSDLDVESHEFNVGWRVLTDRSRSAHAVLDPVVIDGLNALGTAGARLVADAGGVVLALDGHDHPPATLDTALAFLHALRRALKLSAESAA